MLLKAALASNTQVRYCVFAGQQAFGRDVFRKPNKIPDVRRRSDGWGKMRERIAVVELSCDGHGQACSGFF